MELEWERGTGTGVRERRSERGKETGKRDRDR
jgi:hypothetical protein